MRRAAFAAVALLAVVGLMARSAAPVAACTCIPYATADHAERAGVIVVGKITDVFNAEPGGNPDLDAQMSVERYLKGSGPERIQIDDGRGGGDCGFISEQDVGRRYLMFLGGDSNRFTGICSGNIVLCDSCVVDERVTEAEEALRLAQDRPSLGEEGGDDTPWLPIIAAAIVVPLAVTVVVVIRQRTNPPR
jgi:hypothetical protein